MVEHVVLYHMTMCFMESMYSLLEEVTLCVIKLTVCTVYLSFLYMCLRVDVYMLAPKYKYV